MALLVYKCLWPETEGSKNECSEISEDNILQRERVLKRKKKKQSRSVLKSHLLKLRTIDHDSVITEVAIIL